jgi:hypothetical protein
VPTDDGIIWEFDGTRYLQDREITLQARVHDSILNQLNSGHNGLSLFYGINVPIEYRSPLVIAERGRGTGGLWLPNTGTSPLYNIIPGILRNQMPETTESIPLSRLQSSFPAVLKNAVSVAGPLFIFDDFKANNSAFSSGGKLDFVLRLNIPGADPNLFVARFAPPSGTLPSNWYNFIRPFSFDIQDIRLQRGGVTVLNNVINPTTHDNLCYIRYHLVRPGRVTVQIYTLDGTLVRSIRRNEHREAGEWTDVWDGTNNGGRPVARGMYFVRVVAPDINEIRQIMVYR